jgi:hypothetical protein
LNAREEMFAFDGAWLAALHTEKSNFLGFPHHMEKHMTKVTFLSAALVAAAVFTTQAMAAGSDVAARRATTAASCVRAPDVGAYASDPYTVPPCEPSTGF